MKIIGIIPARMKASRLPNKPLLKLNGMPMIGHVYNRIKFCKNLNDVYVATCDKEIQKYVNSIGGKCIMTLSSHIRATDRTAEAFDKISKENDDISGILMIQGDEPLVNPTLLDKMIDYHLDQKDPFITNLISKIHNYDEFKNVNTVKVVKSNKNHIIYMSRALIPACNKDEFVKDAWKQLGLILFSSNAIRTYSKLSPTLLENIESVDMNRILENDLKIKSFETTLKSQAVDVIEDIFKVERLLKKDEYVKKYI